VTGFNFGKWTDFRKASNFPFSTLIVIIAAICIIRTKSLQLDETLFMIIGEPSDEKLFAFAFSIASLIIFEFFFMNKIKNSRSAHLIPLPSRVMTFFSNKTLRFIFTLLFVNLLTWINLSQLQSLAKTIYSFVRIGPLYPHFADLRTTLLGISCNQVNEIGSYISCGNRGNNWTYPTVLLELRSIMIEAKYANWIMCLALIALTIYAYLLTVHFPTKYFYFLALLFASPPFMIAIERGNVDIFILILLLVTLVMFGTSEPSKEKLVGISVLLAIASCLKFYPFIGLLCTVYSTLQNRKRIGSASVALVIAIAIFTFLILIRDIPPLMQQSVNDLSGSIGLKNIVALASGMKDTAAITFGSSLVALGLLIFTFHRKLWTATTFYLDLNWNQRLEILITSSVATFPWMMSTNYYYRLILLWPLFFSVFRLSFINQINISVLLRVLIFPTLLGLVLVFRTFALLQNIALVPVYLLFFYFVIHEIQNKMIRLSSKFR
jgi:hypothetical protein